MISGNAKLACVIGWPISHSKSPRLHGFWIEQYGLDAAYVPVAVPPDRLEEALQGMAAMGFAGGNITIPHKVDVMGFCAQVSDRAKAIGAVNTLVMKDDGTLSGDNTDGEGFLNNLYQGAPDWSPKGVKAVVIGAGGAARAIIYTLAVAGASEIVIANRNTKRGEDLAKDMADVTDASVWAVPLEMLSGTLSDSGLLVNTTSLGMTGQPPLVFDGDALSQDALVTDIVYTPLETDLLAWANARGNPTVDGIGMLLHQAVPGFEQWFGYRPEVTKELRDFTLETPEAR